MLALCFDTETSGLVENRTIKDDKLPELIEFYGCIVDLAAGTIIDELERLIRPTRPLSDVPAFGEKKTITQITGITNEMLLPCMPFSMVGKVIIEFIESAPLVIAHNASFDKEILDIEAERLHVKINWPRVLCSVEQTIHLKGKRLSLGQLHELLFDEKFNDAHRAKNDVQALVRCCVELYRRDEL